MATIRRRERHLMSQETYDQIPTILKDRSKVCVGSKKEAIPFPNKVFGTPK